ncbi:MAG: dTMP kinase [Campylobacteraceae bacterium]|jgi:dTMP kinase|nr:dTMP kinase [Campylobacteraceae bacterium]
MFALFEGIDTTGKSTQVKKLQSVYPDMIATYEPGATQLGAELRSILLEKELHIDKKAELLLFLADRAEHYEKVVAPNADKLVVSDRGFVSGIAYALTNSPEMDLSFLIELNRFALGGKFPEKIAFFKTNEKLLRSRINGKSHDKIEQRGINYLLSVQENMQKVLDSLQIKYIVLDASESIEDLHIKIKRFLND